MGSKVPDEHRRAPDESRASEAVASTNPPRPAVATGLLPGVVDGDSEDADEDDVKQFGCDLSPPEMANLGQTKKRKNRKKKRKSAGGQQTVPPRVALDKIFKARSYPEGEIIDYIAKDDNLSRTTNEEVRQAANIMDDEFLADYRKAAEVHRQVRQHVQTIAKPGVSMAQIADEIETGVRALTGHQGIEPGDALKAGMGFPTGLCLNHVGAHWTPNPGQRDVILNYDDVLKIDYGVHVHGRIVDSAFTIAHNPIFDPLLDAVKAATNTGLKEAGIDARIDHISETVQEVMESYEVEVNGKMKPVKAVRNITGHNILRYKIHGDKQVPFVKTKTNQRMEEGDIFAIETFGTTGKAWMHDDVGIYGYGRDTDVSASLVSNASARSLLKKIDENFGTLVFSKRFLGHAGIKNYHLAMKHLIDQGIIDTHGPLVDVPGSHVAQFEHTVLLRPQCKEVVSRGDDY